MPKTFPKVVLTTPLPKTDTCVLVCSMAPIWDVVCAILLEFVPLLELGQCYRTA